MFVKIMAPVISKTGPKTGPKLDRPEQGVLEATNAARKAHGAGALRVGDRLTRAADARARKLAAGGEFSHSGWEKALLKVGYRPSWGTGENIAYGQDSAEEVVQDWMDSSGHRRNMLDPKFKAIGVAYHRGAERDVWVQLFGRR